MLAKQRKQRNKQKNTAKKQQQTNKKHNKETQQNNNKQTQRFGKGWTKQVKQIIDLREYSVCTFPNHISS